jgi:hypothetical protein
MRRLYPSLLALASILPPLLVGNVLVGPYGGLIGLFVGFGFYVAMLGRLSGGLPPSPRARRPVHPHPGPRGGRPRPAIRGLRPVPWATFSRLNAARNARLRRPPNL